MAEKNIIFAYNNTISITTCATIATQLGIEKYCITADLNTVDKTKNEIIIWVTLKGSDDDIFVMNILRTSRNSDCIYFIMGNEKLFGDFTNLKFVTGGFSNINQVREKLEDFGYVFKKDKSETKQQQIEKYDWSTHSTTLYTVYKKHGGPIKADYLLKCKIYNFVLGKMKEFDSMDFSSSMTITCPIASYVDEIIDCFNFYGYKCVKGQGNLYTISL